MKKLILIILFSIAVFAANAQTEKSLLDSANLYYTAKQYDKAIEAYNKVLALGFESVQLYYDLGNSYYRSGNFVDAIINYERAKLLAPGDEDINYNLQVANKFVVDKIEKMPEFFVTAWYNNFKNLFSSDMWAYISMGAFIVFLALLALFLFSGNVIIKKLAFWVSLIVLIISIFSFLFSYRQKNKIINRSAAIIYVPTINVKSSPDTNGKDIFILHEGTKVSVIDSIGTWREIKLGDGTIGWLEAANMVVI